MVVLRVCRNQVWDLPRPEKWRQRWSAFLDRKIEWAGALTESGQLSCVLFLNGRKYFLEILSRISLEIAH